MSQYTITVTVDADLATTEQRVRDALSAEGFGILSEIDVQATLRDKLGEDIGGYKILGACNPPLARRAIDLDDDIGALLPCNVLLRANPDGGTDVAAADPQALLALSGDELQDVATDAEQRLRRALHTITVR